MDYKSGKWKSKRERILRRDKYQCQHNKRYGKHVQANTVHHILPCEVYPEYEWEDWNLIALSHDAHNKMHDRDTHELTEIGKYYARRVARERGLSIAI